MKQEQNILLAFYGDDLTGSTDALEFICRAGAKAVLFMEPPTKERLKAYPGLQAFGVAGLTRSLAPGKMEQQLLPAFELMKASGARHVHYKVCSTFDSSPTVGSIGKAIDCGATVFKNKIIPVLGGMPALGRYCLFGNLFARMGIGSSGKIYRLDRHPSMSRHPVTPSHESDLRLHIGSQTNKKIGLIDVVELGKDIYQWNAVIQSDEELVLLDALNEEQLIKIGEWIDTQVREDTSLFSVGSSGIEMALGVHWNKTGILKSVEAWPIIQKTEPLLVISGSCSPVTTAQIKRAKECGFEEVVIDAQKICNGDVVAEDRMRQIANCLQQKKDLMVHTGTKGDANLSSEILGSALGCIAKEVVNSTGIKRVVIAGGDTSSYAARAMDIEALEMIAPFVSGAPLCKAHSKNKSINNIEVNLKGGQVGGDDYFVLLKEGNT